MIRNLIIKAPGGWYVGLFGRVGRGALVKNLRLEKVQITGKSFVGGLTGDNLGTISFSYSTGSLNGHSCVGGLAGSTSGGKIFSCFSSVDVKGDINVGVL